MKKSFLVKVITTIVLLCLYTFLFLKQSVYYNNLYFSDLPMHIQLALQNDSTNYSLVSIILKFLYTMTGDTKLIALFLGSVGVGTVIATYKLLQYVIKDISENKLFILAILLNFTAPLFLFTTTIGFQNPSVFHNSTYLCMKLIGIITVLVFLKIRDNYSVSIKKSQWVTFMLLLVLINATKPNFIVAFAPAVLVVLLIDLVKYKGKTWKGAIVLCLAFLPSFFILIFQYLALFGNAQETGSGIALDFGYFISLYTKSPLISTLQSIAFPLFILLFNLKRFFKDKFYSFAWIAWLIAFLQFLILIETGSRMEHGNWTWGAPFFLFILFIASMYKLNSNIKDKTFLTNKTFLKINYTVISILLLVGHFVFGIIYFVKLLLGNTY